MQETGIQNQVAARADEAIIRAEKVEKYYAQPSQNRIQVISATDLAVVPGEILALLGPSGSGKSTMLRMLTGLSTPSAGQVYWHEKPISASEINVSIVFQSFALFPWLTALLCWAAIRGTSGLISRCSWRNRGIASPRLLRSWWTTSTRC